MAFPALVNTVYQTESALSYPSSFSAGVLVQHSTEYNDILQGFTRIYGMSCEKRDETESPGRINAARCRLGIEWHGFGMEVIAICTLNPKLKHISSDHI